VRSLRHLAASSSYRSRWRTPRAHSLQAPYWRLKARVRTVRTMQSPWTGRQKCAGQPCAARRRRRLCPQGQQKKSSCAQKKMQRAHPRRMLAWDDQVALRSLLTRRKKSKKQLRLPSRSQTRKRQAKTTRTPQHLNWRCLLAETQKGLRPTPTWARFYSDRSWMAVGPCRGRARGVARTGITAARVARIRVVNFTHV